MLISERTGFIADLHSKMFLDPKRRSSGVFNQKIFQRHWVHKTHPYLLLNNNKQAIIRFKIFKKKSLFNKTKSRPHELLHTRKLRYTYTKAGCIPAQRTANYPEGIDFA